MNKILAIKGHSTRGKEVIEILEMLGGNNRYHLQGTDCNSLYNIREKDDVIIGSYPTNKILQIYALEDFLEKYPIKVGDKVEYKKFNQHADFIYIVKKMIWENNQIKYVIYSPWCSEYSFTLPEEDLQLYKEEIYTECSDNNFSDNSKPGVTVNGEKLIAPKGYTIKTATMDCNILTVEYVKDKPQYPKTYEECCKVLGYNPNKIMVLSNSKDITIEENEHYHEMYNLYQLLICRDAYWKIAGEEMNLGKSWKPIWGPNLQVNYIIRKVNTNDILRFSNNLESVILAFPTKEMRDIFFENFMDLIKECAMFL